MSTDEIAPIAIERMGIEALIPYSNNARTHSDQQVAEIAASIKEFGFCNPVLIDPSNGIVAGHGRLLAARKLTDAGVTIKGPDGKPLDKGVVPCIRLGHLTDAQRRAYILADNKIALNSGWDEDLLRLEIGRLAEEGVEAGLAGFSDDDLKELKIGGAGGDGDETYTRKIEAPIYTPQGDKPDIKDLFNDEVTAKLISEIDGADVPDDVKAFLRRAAERHTVFNFRLIADFYAHSDEKVQGLMERSALVIIDFDQAIENGFVQMSKGMLALVESEAEGA